MYCVHLIVDGSITHICKHCKLLDKFFKVILGRNSKLHAMLQWRNQELFQTLPNLCCAVPLRLKRLNIL